MNSRVITANSVIELLSLLGSENVPDELVLSLYSDHFSNLNMQTITHAITSGKCPKKLALQITECSIEEDVKPLVGILQSENGLTELSLCISSSSGIDESEALRVIAEGLKKNAYLDKLSLSFYAEFECKKWSEAMKALAEVFASGRCPRRFYLDLRGNDTTGLTDEHISWFIKGWESGHCVRQLTLDVTQNQVGPLSLRALASALMSGKCPAALKISFADGNAANVIEFADFKILADALNNRKGLDRLALVFHKNNFYDENAGIDHRAKSIELLVAAAKRNVSLSIFGLNNKILSLCNIRNDLILKYPEFKWLILKCFHPNLHVPFSLTHLCMFSVMNARSSATTLPLELVERLDALRKLLSEKNLPGQRLPCGLLKIDDNTSGSSKTMVGRRRL